MKHFTQNLRWIALSMMVCMGFSVSHAADSWVRTNPESLQSGDVVVIVDRTSSLAMTNDNGTSSAPAAAAVTLSADTSSIEGTVAANLKWEVTVGKDEAGAAYYQFGVAGTKNYLYCTSSNNGVRVGTNANNQFSIQVADANNKNDYLFNNGTSRYIGVYSNQDWRCYTTVNNNIKTTLVTFYKKVASSDTRTETVTTISAEGITNKNLHVGTTAGSLSATVTADGTAISGATVTWSSSESGVATVDETTGVVTLVGAGSTEITANYAGDATYVESEATYTLYVVDFDENTGTASQPYTVAQARAAIDAGTGVTGVYATGIVSKIVTPYNEKYGNISYNISADGTTEGDQLEAYRGFGKEGAWFTSADDIQVGDEVVIYGDLTKYNSTYEFAEGNQLVSLKRATQEKKEAGIAYETKAYTITVGDEFTAPTLTNPNGLTVSYAGDNDKLATVDATSGRITLTEGATGEVTVTASFAGNDEYEAGEASYTLTVEEKTSEETGDYDYEKITSTDDLEDGEYLIVYEDGDVAFDGSGEGKDGLDRTQNSISVSISDNKIASSTTVDAATVTLTSETDGWTVKSKSGYFIGVSSYSNGLSVQTDASKAVKHTISFDSDGNADLICYKDGDKTMSFRYNASSNNLRFRYYKDMGQKPVALYKKTQLKATNVEMPTFSPEGGEYTGTQNVTISCATEGSTIYYTTDGSNPTDASTPYTEAISIEETTTIKAIAYDATGESSNIATAVFTIKIPHTWDVTEQGYTETTELETVLTDPVTITFAVGGASATNTPKYYVSGNAARIYGKNTLTISAPEGKAISSIKVNYVEDDASRVGPMAPTAGTYTLEGTTGTWSGIEPIVELSPSSQIRIQSIDVETVDLEEIGSVTVSEAGYATYCNLQPCIVGDGSVTFVVPMAEGSTLEEEAIGTIPAGTGVLVTGEGTYKVYGHAKLTGNVKANHLIGVVEETTVPTNCYVLQNQDGNVAFYKVQEGTAITLGANKAYLDSSIDAGGAVKAFFMGEEAGEATGIDTVDASAEKATEIYNLNGQRVSVMTKGIYIVNGKKVLVK